MSTSGRYHEYIKGCSVHRRDIMIHVGYRVSPLVGTGGSPVTTLFPSIKVMFLPQKFPENSKDNNSLLFLNNSLFLEIAPLINLPEKILGGYHEYIGVCSLTHLLPELFT